MAHSPVWCVYPAGGAASFIALAGPCADVSLPGLWQIAQDRTQLESQPQPQLKDSWIVHRGNLPKRSGWIGRVRSGAERTVLRQVVTVIERVERFHQPFQPDSLSNRKGSADARVHTEKVVPNRGIPVDESSVHTGPRRSALNRG